MTKSAKKAHASDPSQLSFEDSFARVEAIIARIEHGEIGLEEALAEYERGVQHIARCRAVLAQAEQKISILDRQVHAAPAAPASSSRPPGDPAAPDGSSSSADHFDPDDPFGDAPDRSLPI